MKLNKIKLNNIRSYVEQEINFPSGTVLLGGDIGSGKSSILLAIDFALFGLRLGELTGSSLLRNGADKGHVELDFEVGGKNIIIKRSLKRGKTVNQDEGFISVDGEMRNATATELKQKILELFNYPPELLKKSKSLVYRYTVYTPQEEMKQILLGDKDFRVDTLRKVFGIDKYKRVRENVDIVNYKLKEKRKLYAGMIADLEVKKSDLAEKERKIGDLEKQLVVINADLKTLIAGINEHKENLAKIEDNIKRLDSLKKELEINDVRLTSLVGKKSELHKEIETLVLQIKSLEKDIDDDKGEGFDKDKKVDRELRIKELQEEVNKLNLKINELNTKKKLSEDLKNKMITIDNCPTCKQEVNKEHKHHITEREDSLILGINKQMEELRVKRINSEKEFEIIKKEYDEILIIERKHDMNKLRYNNLSEKIERKDKLIKEAEEIKKNIGDLNIKNAELYKEIDAFGKLGNKYDEIKEIIEGTDDRLKSLEVEKGGIDKELTLVLEIIENLKKEIKKKEIVKEKIVYLGELQHWLSENFKKMMEIMEKKVMLAVHSEFNSLFQKWFNMLIEEDIMNVRLDEEFTPVIEQNGYETDFLHLSGGEKTAASLAYRLALNQVINTVMSVINTKDLLILDEPTDGFSAEQLDRVREVLNEIDTKQVILVSHEPKIESFVDSIIRLNKSEHVSEVIE
ncbi:MAG: SMC family ATPase [Candidatus Nanoarchaeia archaeon]|nr:SMC family ATPase [Candidatus Nanoarchaeia archaeon]